MKTIKMFAVSLGISVIFSATIMLFPARHDYTISHFLYYIMLMAIIFFIEIKQASDPHSLTRSDIESAGNFKKYFFIKAKSYVIMATIIGLMAYFILMLKGETTTFLSTISYLGILCVFLLFYVAVAIVSVAYFKKREKLNTEEP